MTLNDAANRRAEQGRVTLQIIADRLAVSTATVSLALRDSTVVADVTKRKVQRVAREMGYIYNRSAASLRTSRTNILAVAFHDVSNPYFAEMLTAIDETVRSSGRTILLGTCNESIPRQENVLSSLREYRPDGIIVCPVGGSTEDSLRNIAESGMPIVQVAREIDGLDADFVGADDTHSVEIAVDHLIKLGHTRIAYVGGNESTSNGRLRHRSFKSHLEKNGLQYDHNLMISGSGTRVTGLDSVAVLMAQRDAPTAIVCFNDSVAFGVLHGLQRSGLEAGRDVSVVGCDDVGDAALWVPPLTTVHNQHIEMGRLAAEMLMRRIADPGQKPRRITLEPRLVLRSTTAPPRAA
ncbi:MAG: LacI family DNA-binding transcriptional regulator [Beijerinckiaceae bacterium]